MVVSLRLVFEPLVFCCSGMERAERVKVKELAKAVGMCSCSVVHVMVWVCSSLALGDLSPMSRLNSSSHNYELGYNTEGGREKSGGSGGLEGGKEKRKYSMSYAVVGYLVLSRWSCSDLLGPRVLPPDHEHHQRHCEGMLLSLAPTKHFPHSHPPPLTIAYILLTSLIR